MAPVMIRPWWPNKSESKKMVHATGASLYGVLVHDASLGGLKGLDPSGSLGDITFG